MHPLHVTASSTQQQTPILPNIFSKRTEDFQNNEPTTLSSRSSGTLYKQSATHVVTCNSHSQIAYQRVTMDLGFLKNQGLRCPYIQGTCKLC